MSPAASQLWTLLVDSPAPCPCPGCGGPLGDGDRVSYGKCGRCRFYTRVRR